MLQLQLYIEGKQVELYKNESVSLTQSIQDIKDISKIFTDFTRTFNVPASKSNNKIFQHFYNFNLKSYNTKNEKYESFDARRKKDAELYLNYKPYKEGKIKFEGVTLKNNEPHTYKITFYGNILNLKDTVKDDKLANLSHLSLFDFSYNDTNIITYLSNGYDVDFFGGTISDAIIFPLITHTGRLIYDNSLVNDTANKIYNINTTAGTSSSYGVPISELKPAIRLYALIKAIESEPEYNLKFSEDFFSTTNYDFFNLYMWLHNKEGALFQDQDAQYQIKGFNNIIGDVSDISGVTNKTFVNDYNENDENRILRVNVTPSGTAAYSLVIKKNGEEFKRFDNLTGVTTNGITNFKNENIEIPNGVYTFFIETIAVSSYTVDISVEIKNNGIFKKNSKITIKQATASFVSDKEVSITSIIPDFTIINFLSGLFKMFNLTAYQNTEGVIVVEPLNDFFARSTQVWDITTHLDKEKSIVNTILPFKDINFKYKGTDSFLANNHKQLANLEWGELEYKKPDKFEGKSYEIELPFEHFKYEHLYITDNGVIQTSATPDGNQKKTNSNVQFGYSVNKDQEPYLGDPLIFYAGTPIASIGVLKLDQQTNQSVSAPYIPLNSNGVLNIFGSSEYQTLNFNEEYDEYSRQVNERSLFKIYYESYVKDMFDVRKRLTTVSAYLPLEITIKLNLADKIIVFNNIYRINKIVTNFETNLSTIELNNIFEEVTYKTILAVALEGFTVDNTDIFASNFAVTTDGDTDNQAPIPDITTVVPNVIPINLPTPVFDATPLVVKAPKIQEYQVTVPTTTSVFFNYEITDFGLVGATPKVDEYGFLYSTTKADLEDAVSGIFDIATIRAKAGVFDVPFKTTPFFTVPKVVNYERTGLTHPATLFWRFYARTNIDPANGTADSTSTVQTASTVAAPVSQFNNANGDRITGYVNLGPTFRDYATVLVDVTGSKRYSPSDLVGVTNIIEISVGQFSNASEDTVKKVVEWFTSQYDPVKNAYYPITHTWKYENRFGDSSGIFAMTSVTGAQIKYSNGEDQKLRIYITGGTRGGSQTQGSVSWSNATGGDLISTS